MLRGCLVWSGVIRWLVVVLLFALSVSICLFRHNFFSHHLHPFCLFAASFLWSLLPQRSRLSPSPLSPRCCGRLARIPRLWTWVWLWRRYFEDCGLLAGGRGGGAGMSSDKSSELSAHPILVGGEFGQILRAERSSNLGRRVVRIKSSKLSSHQMPVGGSTGRFQSPLHQSWLWVLWYYNY